MWLYASLLSSSSSYASSCPLLVLKLVLLAVGLLPLHVTARFLCEGGHICSLPRDCCTQGCCPAYQGGPRPLPPPSEHVLNLFFISHWFFWCVVVAIILAILCAYSLWKKRRTLCGWGFNEHHTQSEGDSAGSCYAPPQYSRCNSFHHPPPPYTEVTSKPDLYPLVFTCNSDNGKGNGNGSSSYLMSQSDQHFRYMANSSSSLSDIFVNNSCVAGLGGAVGAGMAHGGGPSIDSVAATQAASLCSLAVGGGGGTPVIFSNGCIQPNPLHSLENCCQHSSMPVGMGDRDPTSGLGPVGTASTASGVSSLANIGTPVSPPQATSPTGEVREILDQIRQLQAGVSYEHLLLSGTGTGAKPRLQHTLSTPSSSQAPQPTAMTTSASGSSAVYASASGKSKKLFGSNKAPPPPNKALYIPMAAMGPGMGMSTGTAQRCLLKSPVSSVVSGASFFVNRGRVARKGWITRSAPTTPGSALPPNRLGDDSPLLLNEHDEDTIDDDNEDLDIETETETEAEAQDHRRLAHRQPHRHHRHGQRRRNGQIE
ncbi:GL22641 [Drosophila persimilis]|uniref:WW domain binding protein VOPP1 n=1 Tax=Drosophila persimilis TaxID=7234 RepID=B4HA20_DROPE|nr:GL22641 [Drosophila persimilis]